MRMLYRIKYALGKWVNTPFGCMPKGCYDFECDAPTPKLLSLIVGNSDRDVSLIRLKLRKEFSDSPRSGTVHDYGYELDRLPVADSLVPQLTHWAIHIYGDQTIFAPSEDVVFIIRRAV